MHPSKLCALAAVVTITSATAAMAAATQVNVTDPKATNRAAKVEVGSRLAVQEVPPTSFFHSVVNLSSASSCLAIAAPPAGKALIVRQIRVNTTANPAPGPGQELVIFDNPSCISPSSIGRVGSVNPPTVGVSTIPFDPGLAISSGGGLSASVSGSIKVEVYIDGYTVDSSVAPQVGQTLQQR